VLLAGEDRPPGSGRYLLGLLARLGATVTHVPSGDALRLAVADAPYDLFIFSDFASAHASAAVQARISAQVQAGSGLCMVGGWGSFSGPFGRWHGSLVGQLLPVRCRPRDDRTECPSGAWVLPARAHPILRGLPFGAPAAVCGLNRVRPKPDASVLLVARRLDNRAARPAARPALEAESLPLLVIGRAGAGRTAACTTDASPHWCGGLADWGGGRVRVRLDATNAIEVGSAYLALFVRLFRWAARRPQRSLSRHASRGIGAAPPTSPPISRRASPPS